MAEKEVKIVHTIEFPIESVEGYKHPRDAFDKNFHYLHIIHNAIVKEANRRLDLLFRDRQYKAAKAKFGRCKDEIKKLPKLDDTQKAITTLKKKKKEAKTVEEKEEILKKIEEKEAIIQEHKKWAAKKKEAAEIMNERRIAYDLKGKYSLGAFTKVIGAKYSNYIQAMQYAAEAQRVWAGVDKVLFGDGKSLNYKKYNEMHSVTQSTTDNGIKFNLDTAEGTWGKGKKPLKFRVKIDWNDPYVVDSVVGNKIKYYEIKRRMFKTGFKYYLVLVMEGPAPKTINDIDRKGTSTAGVKINLSTMAWVSEDDMKLARLAPEATEYEKEVAQLQRKIDRSLRATNPENYNEDGTCKKGKHEWKVTNNVKRMRKEVTELNRKKSEYVVNCHNTQINEIIKNCNEINYQICDVKEMAEKKKKTERQEKVNTIEKKNGEKQQIHKYKRKKRYGKSIGTYAPSDFGTRLEKHAEKYGIPVNKISQKAVDPYNYDPINDMERTYDKKRLREVGDTKVQVDLNAGYLLSKVEGNEFKVERKEYEKFMKEQEQEIKDMKNRGESFKHKFGF